MSNQTSRCLVLLPYWLDENIYIRELGRAYRASGAEVVFGAVNLFEPAFTPDIVHIHWPELYRSAPAPSSKEKAAFFLNALDAYRQVGATIVWTVHNLLPHESSVLDAEVYQGIIDRADLIVHHCTASQRLLEENYRLPRHVTQIVTPHGHYFSYPSGVTKAAARLELGIPDDAFVYLHFGNVRRYKGLDNLLAAFTKVRPNKKWLLVAGNYSAVTGKGALHDRLLIWWIRKFSRRTSLHLRTVPSERVQIFMSACDCVVLAHNRGLNSGVAILGMTFGRPVIGPDIGCIAAVLGEGDNVIYKAGDVDSLVEAMERVTTLNSTIAGEANIKVAQSWTWESIAQKILGHAGVVRKMQRSGSTNANQTPDSDHVPMDSP